MGAALLFAGSGCGTMRNVAGQEIWLMGPPPERPIAPFGGVDNDVRLMSRAIGPEGCDSCGVAAAACDMPFSFVGDIITLPWTTYQWLMAKHLHPEVNNPPQTP